VTNTGSGDATGVVLTDALPAGVRLTAIPAGARYDEEARTLQWSVERLTPGQTLSFDFSAIATGRAAGQPVVNIARVSANEVATPVEAQATVQVRAAYLQITKRADRALAEIGDIPFLHGHRHQPERGARSARYRWSRTTCPRRCATCAAAPSGQGQPVADPEQSGRTLTWRLESIPAGQSVDLVYRVAVGTGGGQRQVNRVRATARTPEGEALRRAPPNRRSSFAAARSRSAP
jgi:hypothetical protein